MANPAWAQNAPNKEQPKGTPTTQPAQDKPKEQPKQDSSQPASPSTQPSQSTPKQEPAKPAATSKPADLDAAKRAALESLDKDNEKLAAQEAEADKPAGEHPEPPVPSGSQVAPQEPGATGEPTKGGVGPGTKRPPRISPAGQPRTGPAVAPGRSGGVLPADAGGTANRVGGTPLREPPTGPQPGRPTTPAPTSPRAGASDRQRPTPPGRTPTGTPPVEPSRPQPGHPAGGGAETAGDTGPALSPVVDTMTTMTFTVAPPNPEARTYRFDYDNTPWADVLADFSRISGLPWLNQPDPPMTDNLTFRSPREFTYKEALEQLNEMLLSRPVSQGMAQYLIERQENYLIINRLSDALARKLPLDRIFDSFQEFEAAKLDRFDICLTYLDAPPGWSPWQVIEEFRPMFSDTYGTQVVGNRIELTGLAEEHRRFRDLVYRLGMKPPPPLDPRPTRTFQLKIARAADIQTTLKQLFPGPLPAMGGKPGGPGIDRLAEQAKQVTILTDVRNNAIIVRGPEDVLTEIEQLIRQLDGGEPAKPPVMKVVKLEHGSALMVQNVLKPLFQAQKNELNRLKAQGYVPPEMEAQLDRDLIADQVGNSVVVFGSREGVAAAEELVKQWDVPDTDITEIIELKNADAATVSAMVTALLPPAQMKGGIPPRIVPQTGNKLLVACGKQEIERIRELIDKLDVRSDPDEKEHFVQLQSATPSVIAPIIQQIVSGQAGPMPQMIRRPPQPGQPPQPVPPQMQQMSARGGPGAKFIPDDSSGILLVICDDKDWERIEPLIKKLDDQAAPLEPMLRSFELKSANAADVANMLQQLFPPTPAVAGQRSAMQVVTADPYNNKINIFANTQFIEKVTPFIEQLDIETDGDVTVIKLEHAQAAEIAPILGQAFAGGGGAGPIMAVQPGQPGKPPMPMAPRSMGGGAGVRVVAEPITNSLLVTAPPRELVKIHDMVARMEEAAQDKKDTRLILRPENRPVEEIVQTLQSLAGGGPRIMRPIIPGQPPQPQAPAAGQLKVVASGESIILDGPQDEVAKAVQLFAQIDVVEQQPLSRKYAVMDAEEDAKKLSALLGLGAGRPAQAPQPPGQPGSPPGGPGAARGPGVISGQRITVYPDTYENVLLVRAMPSEFPKIDEQLRLIMSDATQVDPEKPITEGAGSFFVHHLKYKKAYDLAWDLEELLNPSGKGSLQFDEGPDEKMLIVRGCKPAQKEEVIKCIEMFDVPESGRYAQPEVLVLESKKMPPEQLLKLVQENFKSPTGSTLKVVGPEAMGGRVRTIDIHEGEPPEEPAALTTQPALRCVLPSSLLASIKAAALAATDDPPQPGATAEPVLSTQPGVEPPASAEPTATQLTGSERPPSEIQATIDPQTGKLIFKGPEEELDEIGALIEEMTGGEAPIVYCKFPLKYVDVAVAAQLLNDVLNQPSAAALRMPRQRQQPQQQPGAEGGKGPEGGPPQPGRPQQPQLVEQPAATGNVKITPDARTRCLFVSAPLPQIPLIEDLLRMIDTKVPPSEQNIRIFRLVNLDATQVVENLREILGISGGTRRLPGQLGRAGRQGMTPEQMQQMQQQQQEQILQMQGQQGQAATISPTDNIKLTADSQTNTIIAQAPPDTLTLIENLITELESETNTTKQEMRRVQLVHARATDVASIVRDVAGQVVTGPGAGGPGGVPGMFGGRATSGRGGRVSVNADPRTNSVILAGQAGDLDRVEKIVKDLDNDDERGSNIKQIAVKGDAQTIANALKTVFAAGQQSDIVITADPSSGIILVKAPAAQMADIEKQITEMDSKVAVEQQRRSIKLEFGDAEGIATSLQAIFADARSKRGAKQNVVIKGNKSNNTIYVSGADDEVYAQIEQIAKDMDSAPSGIQVKSFPLKHASAIDVNEKLTAMMAKAAATGSLGNMKLDLVGVVPDARTNSIIVTGGPITFVLIDDVLAAIDVESPTPVARVTKSYTLPRSADANQVAANINSLFSSLSFQKTGIEPPSVTANTAANVVMVIANDIQHEQIKTAVIDPIMQAVGEPPQDYQIVCKFVRADEAKITLEDFMSKWRQAQGNKPQDAFTITADPNSNMLLLNCSPATFEIFKKQLDQIDTEAIKLAGERQSVAYVLKYANPQSVQSAIQTQFTRASGARVADREQVSASIDWDTKTVVVVANKDNHLKVKEIVDMMDAEMPPGSEKQTRFFQLKFARADALANILNQSHQASVPRPRSGVFPITYASEMTTNTLSVTAPADQFTDIEKTIAELDKEDISGRQTKTFAIKYAAPWSLATLINQQFRSDSRNPQDQVIASFDDGTMTVVVTSNERKMQEVEKLILELDNLNTGGLKETRFIQLKNARADELANAMRQAFESKTVPSRTGKWPVTITADVASNNLIVTAPADMFPDVDAMIVALDVKEQGTGERLWQTFRLTYADPGSVSRAIQTAFQQTGRNPSPRDRVTSSDDWTTNSVLVSASAENMGIISKIVEEMDLPGDALRTQQVIEVVNSNAQDVAQSLQQIFDAANAGRRGRASATIRAIAGTTKIAAYANAEEFKQIQELIKQIDVEGGREVHTVPMPELVSARSVAENINKLFGPQSGRRDGPAAEYHEPTNTLLVHATASEFAQINDQVIKVLTQTPAVGLLKIFKVPLKHALADEVAQTLQGFFDKKSGVQRGGNMRPPWWGPDTTAKSLENQVTIIAEPAANMLIVYCTDTTKEIIDDLLKDIDTDEPPGGKKIMEMVTLKFIDAADALSILTEYLKVSKRTPEDQGRRQVPWWMDTREIGGEEKVVLAGDTRLTAVESMNAIIVVGKPESVQDAIAKITEIDVERPDSGDDPRTIKLVNASASELAETLKTTFNDPARNKVRGASYVPPTIIPVEATNSLVVRAKPSDFNLIQKMAEGLDQEMKDETGGVRILPVPVGRNVEELAGLVEDQINESEQNKQKLNREYKPNLVSIGADTTASALLVAASKSQFEEVERLVNDLVAMGPAGGTSTRVIKLQSMTPQQAKQLIEQLQQGGKGQSGGRGSRGPRGDADWTRNRRYENLDGRGEKSGKVERTAYATTLPILAAQIALSTAIAQAPTTQPSIAPTTQPKVFTIRKAEPPAAAQTARSPQPPAAAGGSPPSLATTQPALPRGMSPEQAIRAATQPSGGTIMSPEAREAFQQKLSGAPIVISEAGPDSIVYQGNPQDLEIIEAILHMLDTEADKKLEYVKLKNSRAADLARTLQEVFAKIEQKGQQPAQPRDKVDIIADPRTNGIYIAATEAKMAQAMELIEKNEAAPLDIETSTRSYVFKNRRVSEAGEVLKKMVASYLKKMGLPADSITAEIDPQTNSVFITGGENDLKAVDKILEFLDAELPDEEVTEGKKRPMGEADIMVVPLRVADADALGTLLNELLQKAATGDTPMKDFIRRMRLLDENGEPIAQIDLNRPIAIFGDKDSNALIIASSKENCLIMKQVAKAFDVEPARAEVQHKVVSLDFADATEVAEQIDKLLTDSEGLTQRPGKSDKFGVPDGPSGALVYQAVIQADARTNQVVVIGRPDAVVVIENLVKQLDVKGLDVMPFEIVKLEYASATALEEALADMMEKRAEALPKGTGPNADKAEKVIIKGDPRSESLIVAAKPARMEELRGLIGKLDVPAAALIENIRTISLKNGNAMDLSDKLKDLWEQRKSQREGGAGALKLEIPAIVPDERSNSLIVAASKADFEAIKSVVDKIEALPLNPMADIYIVRLRYNSAKQLAPAFTTLFDKRAEMRTADGKTRPEDKVSIEVDEVSNSLLIAASKENYDVLMRKVTELDAEFGVPGQIEFFVCDNVTAQRVKDTIEALFEEGPYKPGGGGDSEVSQERERVTMTIDDRSNILIVSASPENMELVREIYKRMNSVTTPWDVAISKLIVIEHGDSVKIAAQVQEYFDKLKEIREAGREGGGGTGFEITVFADERSNRVIVGGTKDGIDSAVEMIRKLDVPPGTPGQVMHVYTLREAPASKVGEMIQNIFEERNQPRQGATGPQVSDIKVTVESNDANNSLLINASKEDHILVADLVARLDRPSTLMDMVKVFPLEKARSERVKEILEELYQSAGGGEGRAGRTIAVVEDKRTNAVVVAAPPGELENIAGLVARLDTAEVKGQAEIGIFICENEDAEKMTELLNAIMTGQLGEGGGGGAGAGEGEAREISSMLISYAAKDPRGKEVFLKTIRENVQITFSTRSNSVIVVAPPDSLKLIEYLVRQLDQIQKRPVLVKTFMLVNADATKMIEMLEKMFAYDEGTEEEREFQKDREIQVEGGSITTGGVPTAMSQEGTSTKGTFGRPKTTFVADERTNSIIAAGWPEDIDVVADIIDQLDSRPIQDRDNIVFAPVNMKAPDMQTALDQYFQAEQQRLERLGESVSVQRRMEQEVSLVAHEESNQLIISTSPRYRNQVLSILEQLDTPPPQVMIQVMIAEVTLDDNFDMGLEFALQELRFSETAVAGGNGVLQSGHFDVVGGTDLGAAGSGLAGVSFTITGEDFNFLVRALQSDSRLEVIQRPMIMCQDNQTANIIIGQNVPFVRGTSTSDAGQTTAQVEYEEVGIKLEVEPNINPDGFVYLVVKPEISAITDSSVNLGNGVFAPIFTERSAETTVAVKDGETVVIGGLITTSESEAESKVPFLGDVPGLGVLFRTTTRSKNKTELLIALTPHVVRTVEDGRRLSTDLRDESGIITDSMKQSPMFGKLRLQAESEVSDIEVPPEGAAVPAEFDAGAVEPGVVPTGEPPRPPPEQAPGSPQPQKKYGPTAPRYGPLVPADENAVAKVGKRD